LKTQPKQLLGSLPAASTPPVIHPIPCGLFFEGVKPESFEVDGVQDQHARLVRNRRSLFK